jgi:hypothetical protein
MLASPIFLPLPAQVGAVLILAPLISGWLIQLLCQIADTCPSASASLDTATDLNVVAHNHAFRACRLLLPREARQHLVGAFAGS